MMCENLIAAWAPWIGGVHDDKGGGWWQEWGSYHIATLLINLSVWSPKLLYKRSMYWYQGPHHHSCHYLLISLAHLVPLSTLLFCAHTSTIGCQMHCSQAAINAPLDHTQRTTNENMDQFLPAMQGVTNVQAQSINQTTTMSKQPGKQSEWEKPLIETLGSFKVPINETIICSIIVTIMSFFVRNLGLIDKIMRTLLTN